MTLRPRPDAPVTVLTGTYGAQVIGPLVAAGADAEVLAVANGFFGGNIGVAGLLTGADLAPALAGAPAGRRYLLPDVCLSGGPLPRRARPRTCPGRSRWCPPTARRCGAALTR